MQVLVKNTFHNGFKFEAEGKTVLEACRAEYHDADEWRVTADWVDAGSTLERVIRLEKRGDGEWIIKGEYKPEECRINDRPALREPTKMEIWAVRTQYEVCSKLGTNAVIALRKMGLNDRYKGDSVTHVWREDWSKPVVFDGWGRYPEKQIGI